MDQKRANSLVNKYLDDAIVFLGLEDWELRVDVVDSTPETNPNKDLGDCCAKREYRDAHIRIFYKENLTKSDLLDTLYHELGHIFVSMYKGYEEVIEAYFEGDKQGRVFEEMYRQVDERAASNMAKLIKRHFDAIKFDSHKK